MAPHSPATVKGFSGSTGMRSVIGFFAGERFRTGCNHLVCCAAIPEGSAISTTNIRMIIQNVQPTRFHALTFKSHHPLLATYLTLDDIFHMTNILGHEIKSPQSPRQRSDNRGHRNISQPTGSVRPFSTELSDRVTRRHGIRFAFSRPTSLARAYPLFV